MNDDGEGSVVEAEAEEVEAVEAQDPEDDLQDRLQACHRAVDAVLRQHGCTLQARILEPEAVGSGGDCVQIRAAVVVEPMRQP